MAEILKRQLDRLEELSKIAAEQKDYDGLSKLTSAMVTIAAFVVGLSED